jgi:hypothetical protein
VGENSHDALPLTGGLTTVAQPHTGHPSIASLLHGAAANTGQRPAAATALVLLYTTTRPIDRVADSDGAGKEKKQQPLQLSNTSNGSHLSRSNSFFASVPFLEMRFIPRAKTFVPFRSLVHMARDAEHRATCEVGNVLHKYRLELIAWGANDLKYLLTIFRVQLVSHCSSHYDKVFCQQTGTFHSLWIVSTATQYVDFT